MTAVNPFEYVSILVSIILGLGITQLLSSFTDLLYNHRTVRFYWPQLAWVAFVLFLHVQDWIITYQLKDRSTWGMLDLFFVLAYPVALFCVAKMLLPTNTHEEGRDMRAFFHSQFRMVSILMLFCIGFSILFNFHYLQVSVLDQLPLFLFFLTMLLMALRPVRSDRVHQLLAIAILLASGAAVLLTREVWVIG
jgi:hypothetical protein